MNTKKRLFFICYDDDKKNGWAVYTNQIKSHFKELFELNEVKVNVEPCSSLKKLIFRIIFQIFFLPSLWIDSILVRKKIYKQLEIIREPDIIVLDHFYFWWLLKPLKKKYPLAKIVLISHNLEYNNKLSYIRFAPLMYKLFAIIEYPVIYYWERYLSRKADLVTAINSDEKRKFDQFTGNENSLLIYPFIKDQNKTINKINMDSAESFLLVGSYAYTAKSLNAIWISNLFQKISIRKSCKLVIVGKGAPKRMIQRIEGNDRTYFVGEVDCLDSYYNKAKAVIVPERIGGGFKLKILEAIRYQRPILIHVEAFKGTGLRDNVDCLLFSDKESLEKSIQVLMKSPEKYLQLIDNATERAEYLFGENSIRDTVKVVLEKL